MTTDFLEVDALTPDRLAALLDRAQAWKQDPAAVPAAPAHEKGSTLAWSSCASSSSIRKSRAAACPGASNDRSTGNLA